MSSQRTLTFLANVWNGVAISGDSRYAFVSSEGVGAEPGKVDIYDCRTPEGAYESVALHKGYFTENTYTGTSQCLACHGKIGDDVMTTGHWKWEGVASNIAGYEGGTHGKQDLINNFCQAVPSNEGRCTQCHIGIGWKDKNFDFGNNANDQPTTTRGAYLLLRRRRRCRRRR